MNFHLDGHRRVPVAHGQEINKWAARPKGEILCGYLILTGVARFLIEFIRINPRSFFAFRMLSGQPGVDRHWVLFCSGGSGAVRLCNRNLLNLQSVPHIAGR